MGRASRAVRLFLRLVDIYPPLSEILRSVCVLPFRVSRLIPDCGGPMVQRAKAEARVQYAPGSWSSCTGKTFSNCMRLSFCYYPEDILRDGVRRLGTFLQQVVDEAEAMPSGGNGAGEGAAAPAAKRAKM